MERPNFSKEPTQNINNNNIVDILALILAKKIGKKDIGEENRIVIDFYFDLMNEDISFASEVYERKKQFEDNTNPSPENINYNIEGLSEPLDYGRKIPLYSSDDLLKAYKHKKRIKKHYGYALQLSFLQNSKESDNKSYGFENVIDPERKMYKLIDSFNSPYYNYHDKIIENEVHRKRMELREKIGLPVARGKDTHIKDPFYKYLVKRICTFDTFGIFLEYDRVLDEIPQELDSKIKEVGGIVDELLNTNLNNPQKFRILHKFTQEYQDRWNNPK